MKKDHCWICHEELPYRDYMKIKKNDKDMPISLKSHTILVKEQCLESKLEFIYLNRETADSAKNPVIFPIYEGFVHKECGNKIRGYKQPKNNFTRCWNVAIMEDPVIHEPYGNYYTKDACIKVTIK